MPAAPSLRVRTPRRGAALRRALVALLVTGGISLAAAQQRLEVELDAPDEVRPLLERHLRLLRDEDRVLPEAAADRSALARRTRREVAGLLATEGFFDPRVRLDRSEGQRWRLSVELGRRATIGEVELRFEGAMAAAGAAEAARIATLREGWSLSRGKPFRQADWDAAKQQLLDGVSARLYADARIAHSRAEVDPAAATVRLEVVIDSGPPFYLGPLEVSGLRELPEGLVHQYSTLEPGDPYDRDALLAFQAGLQNAPQFASVIVDIDRDPALAAAVPVRVQVTEALPKRLSFGAGYSTNTGYRVEANYRDVNLRERGWELATGLRLEQRRQSAFADVFLPPEQAKHRDSFGALIERSDLEGLRTTSEAVGVARTTQRGNIETRLAFRLQNEDLEPDGAESSSHRTLTGNWTWIQRAVDDLLDPHTGYVLELQLGAGTTLAPSHRPFTRAYTRAVRYMAVDERDVVIVRGELGITAAESREGVPQDFLFRAGGSQSVRGYAYQSLGVEEGDATVGGRYLGTASAEYVHWFQPQWGAAVFVDTGDAADSRGEFELRTGYGAGARWRSPAGPLAVDLAWGHDERRLRLHFGVGIAF